MCVQTLANINVCTNIRWYKWIYKHLLIKMCIQTHGNTNVCTTTC